MPMNNKIKNLLTHNVEEVIIKTDLEKKIESGKKLRIKLGCDPSRPDLHLGLNIAFGYCFAHFSKIDNANPALPGVAFQ